jgi:hypothetical protein
VIVPVAVPETAVDNTDVSGVDPMFGVAVTEVIVRVDAGASATVKNVVMNALLLVAFASWIKTLGP